MIYLVSTYQFARSTSNRSKRQKRSRDKDQSKSFIPLNPIRYMPGSNPFERTIDHQVQRMAPLIRVWKFHAGKSMPCLMNSLRYNSQQSLSNTFPKQHLHLCIRSTYNRFPAHTLVDVVQNSIQNNTTKYETSPAQNTSVVYYEID